MIVPESRENEYGIARVFVAPSMDFTVTEKVAGPRGVLELIVPTIVAVRFGYVHENTNGVGSPVHVTPPGAMKLKFGRYAPDEKVRVIVDGVCPTIPDNEEGDAVMEMGTGLAVMVTFDVTGVSPADAAVTVPVVDTDVVPVRSPVGVKVKLAGNPELVNVTSAFEGNTLAENWFENATFEYTFTTPGLKIMIGA